MPNLSSEVAADIIEKPQLPAPLHPIGEPLPDGLKELAGDAAVRALFDVVRAELHQSGLKQTELAHILGVHPGTISKALSEPKNLTTEHAGRLIFALGKWLRFHAVPLKAPTPQNIYRAALRSHDNKSHTVTSTGSGASLWWTRADTLGRNDLCIELMTINVSPVLVSTKQTNENMKLFSIYEPES